MSISRTVKSLHRWSSSVWALKPLGNLGLIWSRAAWYVSLSAETPRVVRIDTLSATRIILENCTLTINWSSSKKQTYNSDWYPLLVFTDCCFLLLSWVNTMFLVCLVSFRKYWEWLRMTRSWLRSNSTQVVAAHHCTKYQVSKVPLWRWNLNTASGCESSTCCPSWSWNPKTWSVETQTNRSPVISPYLKCSNWSKRLGPRWSWWMVDGRVLSFTMGLHAWPYMYRCMNICAMVKTRYERLQLGSAMNFQSMWFTVNNYDFPKQTGNIYIYISQLEEQWNQCF